MGDVVEITTWPKHQHMFYHVSGSGFTFEARGLSNAAIGLARKPGSSCDYWIGIGDNNRTWIKKDDERDKSVHTPDILSGDFYRGFWLQWNAGFIKLGRDGESKPVITHINKIAELKFVTFSVLREQSTVQWRFILPPVLPKMHTKPVTGGKLMWVETDTQLPDEAIIGGYENEPLYIIRACHAGSLTPGTFIPSEGVGYISWGGVARSVTEFEVLCGFDCIWIPTWEDRIPVGAIEGGYAENNFERLYIGRALHEGHVITGKVQPSHKVCYIPYQGREVAKKKYEILVEPVIPQCVNKTYISEMHVDSASESDVEEDHTWQADDDDEDGNDYESNDDNNPDFMNEDRAL